MKAIAEYFRDLARDDRYFGAEPPTPDAEMLARIAERQIVGRVEARAEGTGIVLRAAGPELAEPAPRPAPARAEPAPRPEVEAQADRPASLLATSAPGPETAAPAPAADSVAAKLERIRAAVGRAAQPSAQALAMPNVADVDDSLAGGAPQPAAPSEPVSPMPVPFDPVVDFSDIDEFAEDLTEVAAEPAFPAQPADTPEPEAVSPEFIAQADAEAAGAAVADDLVADAAGVLAAAADAEVTAVQARIMADDDAGYAAGDSVAAPADDDTDAAAEWEDIAADMPDDIPDDMPGFAASGLAQTTEPAGTAAEVARAPDVIDVTPLRARVIHMKRADFDAAVASGVLAETVEDAEPVSAAGGLDFAALDAADELAGLAADAPMGHLPPEEEAALMAELAEVEREAEELRASQRPGRVILESQPDVDDAAMSRILSQTDAEMAEPEGNRRRAAIAQLKAAVAATEAARRLGETRVDDEDRAQNAFRDDLDQVVRPRRAARLTDQRSERPRPAPLKLVASQRIDLPPEGVTPRSPVMPVRPRRIEISPPAIEPAPARPAETGGFADFAARMGAVELADLLEAAAAYTAFVEGLEDFSRPQLMKKVREAADDDFSREDGLRLFGTLLRQGRITKVANGRFQVAEDTRFRPERRAARG